MTVQASPRVSIIIATHNRRDMLRQSLTALENQNHPPEDIEVIVVLDGCSDGSNEMLANLTPRFTLRWLEQKNLGPATARNNGARQASGEWLIFLDDDIEAGPDLVAAHLKTLSGAPVRVSIGYMPTQPPIEPGYFQAELFSWWEAMFEVMRPSWHRFGYNDLLSGNFALARSLFETIGGFNTRLRCHEDYELGYSLIKHGVQLAFSAEACGIHHEKTTLERSLMRKTEEGIADVQIGRLHPELRYSFLMNNLLKYSFLPSQVMMQLAFHWPQMGDFLAHQVQHTLKPVEQLRRYAAWRRLLYGLLGYWYWRGVRQELPTLAALHAFLAEPVENHQNALSLHIDIKFGMKTAQAGLDGTRPDSASVYYGPEWVGEISAKPGSEGLAGRHLPHILMTQLYAPLMRILAQDNAPGIPELSERLREEILQIPPKNKR